MAKSSLKNLYTTIFGYPSLQLANLVATDDELERLPLAILRERAIERVKINSVSSNTDDLPGGFMLHYDEWLRIKLSVFDVKGEFLSFKKEVSASLKHITGRIDELAEAIAVIKNQMVKDGQRVDNRAGDVVGFVFEPNVDGVEVGVGGGIVAQEDVGCDLNQREKIVGDADEGGEQRVGDSQ